ncbi:hypothetical protein A3Q56_06946 [Intoshia linei]|uniref:DUF4371 domain-containing protein n=1 Tax=Intoshia linei TaxID=1819745 RepID=A0A177ATM1_9BILA|nr:hypothetical protein A3Q56_06946 [Intoshia linei]
MQTILKTVTNYAVPSRTSCINALNEEIGRCSDKIKIDIDTFKKDFCIQFDGKSARGYDNIVEFLSVCLTSDGFSKMIALRTLTNSKSDTIFTELQKVITKYNILFSIKLIICDTTATNTRPINGVVAQMQKLNDLILRHVLNQIFGCGTVSPNIHYSFVNAIRDNYSSLYSNYIGTIDIEYENTLSGQMIIRNYMNW